MSLLLVTIRLDHHTNELKAKLEDLHAKEVSDTAYLIPTDSSTHQILAEFETPNSKGTIGVFTISDPFLLPDGISPIWARQYLERPGEGFSAA